MMDKKWTVALAAAGVVGSSFAVCAEESHPLNTLLPATTLSGFVDTSAVWNFGSAYNTLGGTVPANATAYRFGNTAPDRQDGFNLNAVKIALEKPLDEGQWSAGYKVETLYGSDAQYLPGRLGAGSAVALEQAYVALRAPVGNGLDFKIGQFNSVIGYESTDSYANPNFARSFGFALEPKAHTGILATYQLTEFLGVAGGVANTHFGFSPIANLNQKVAVESDKSYMGALTLKAPDSWGWLAGSSLYAGVVGGADVGQTAGPRPVNLYVGGSFATPIKALSFGVSYDYLFNPYNSGLPNGYNSLVGSPFFAPGVPAATSSYANAFAGYLSYSFTEKFKVNARGEYATSSGGVFLPGDNVNDEKVFGLTVTGDYQLWANVITRAEFRWDRDVGSSAGGLYPFNGQRNDFSLTANVIYKF